MFAHWQLLTPLGQVDLLLSSKEPLPPLFRQHRVYRYEVILFSDRCNSEYSIIPLFLLSIYRVKFYRAATVFSGIISGDMGQIKEKKGIKSEK